MTVLPAPTFLLLNVDEFVLVKVSVPANPDSVRVADAVVSPSYVLFDADAVAVKPLGTIFAVVDD